MSGLGTGLPARGRALNIALIVSGSISCYKACELTSMLLKDGHQVQVIATRAALRFVGTASFEGLTDRKVYTSMWAPRESKTHISLRRWADLFIFYPATANRINQLAAGYAQDLVGATFLANNFEKPFWIAPAANTNMMLHPATRRSLEVLEGWGVRVIHGDSGRLACGDVGGGRLAEPALVRGLVREAARRLAVPAGGAKRALVSGGAMTVPVDAVRSIVNTSSGRTAAAVTAALLDSGWQVDYLAHASASVQDCEGATIVRYSGFDQFRDALKGRMETAGYSLVVHAAAVSDYYVAEGTMAAKQESGSGFSIRLEPNPKLLPLVKEWAVSAGQPEPKVIGFKLTVGQDEAEGCRRAMSYFKGGRVDAVIWNDLSGVRGDDHAYSVLLPPRSALPHGKVADIPDSDLPVVASRGTTLAELAAAVRTLAD